MPSQALVRSLIHFCRLHATHAHAADTSSASKVCRAVFPALVQLSIRRWHARGLSRAQILRRHKDIQLKLRSWISRAGINALTSAHQGNAIVWSSPINCARCANERPSLSNLLPTIRYKRGHRRVLNLMGDFQQREADQTHWRRQCKDGTMLA